ncbi:hypothetical protein A6B44_09910 [Pasteurella skyensis]|uniref:Uncharacterized protein n=1 Tax=Phocoenobacter skyensis TaxID=97481 RepID=A0A1H7WN61_9PAST|nr:hypothetical protein A6B44_09910 [Pasteurella skyensis]SEM22891.1 hypothetical protein SAMN05444853_10925 [Pasteurella skyensis]
MERLILSNKDNLELLITRLDPSESLRLSFFPELDRLDEFGEPQIIINNQELSSIMVQLGWYKKYPSIILSYILMIILMIALLGLIF